MIPLMKKAFLNEYETKKALCEFIMQTERLSMDVKCFEFEKKFSNMQCREDAILFNSGGSANLAVLQALKNLGRLKDGDKIGFSALTWSTNTMPIIQMGFLPVAIDCEIETMNISSEQLILSLNKNNLKDTVFKAYDINTENGLRSLGNSEILQKLTVKDSCKLYTTAITLQNIPLMFPKELNDILENEKELSKTVIAKTKSESDSDECKKVVVAKLYKDEDELLRDNDSGDIYFDKIYDKTNYSILDDYEKEMNNMTPEAFIDFLPNALEKKYKLSPSEAEYLADTLISGIKRVIEGQYAIINIKLGDGNELSKLSSAIEYYIRKNNRWVFNNPGVTTVDSDIFCNLQERCISEAKT